MLPISSNLRPFALIREIPVRMKTLKNTDWPSLILPGSRVFVASGAACPHYLLKQMFQQAEPKESVELLYLLRGNALPVPDVEHIDSFRLNYLSAISSPRQAPENELLDFTPAYLSELPALLNSGVLPVDAVLLQVSAPDELGFCSFGLGADLALAACRAAKAVIAQVNPLVPRTCGPCFLHVSEIDYYIEKPEPLLEVSLEEGFDAATGNRIAQYVAQLIDDGDTLYVDFSAVGSTVLAALRDHRHLGLHTEIFSDACADAMRHGIVDNSRKKIYVGKAIASLALGARRLYDFAADNPHVEFRPLEEVANPLIIAKNERVVSVAEVSQVALNGLFAFGAAHEAGRNWRTGSQIDFMRGAALSRGGRSILVLPSTSGARSNIVVALKPGFGDAVFSTLDAHYVVTEFGIATLRGRTGRERLLELVQVAHPNFREELLQNAGELGWLPAYQSAGAPAGVAEIGEIELRKLTLKDGDYFLRPLHPADERRLQEFFYSHTEETLQRRYGYLVREMTSLRAHELVSVRQDKNLALGIFEHRGPREILCAVGRYYLDADGQGADDQGAELAFVVSEKKRRLGMASILMQTMTDIAKKRGLKYLWGQIERNNRPMLKIFKKFGAKMTGENGEVTANIALV